MSRCCPLDRGRCSRVAHHWVRVWFVQEVTAPIERCCVVRIGIGDSYVGPAMADVAAVQGLRLIRLRDGNPAIPSDLGGVVAEPDNLQLEYLG